MSDIAETGRKRQSSCNNVIVAFDVFECFYVHSEMNNNCLCYRSTCRSVLGSDC